MNEKRKHIDVMDIAHTLKNMTGDVQGSYTGTNHDGEKPVQDADDL